MKIEEFVEKVRSELGKELGDGYRVEPKEVRKNNGVILHGLMVLEQGQNVAPTIYLDTFLEAYESGATFQSILNRLLDICREEASKGLSGNSRFSPCQPLTETFPQKPVFHEHCIFLWECFYYIAFLYSYN